MNGVIQVLGSKDHQVYLDLLVCGFIYKKIFAMSKECNLRDADFIAPNWLGNYELKSNCSTI